MSRTRSRFSCEICNERLRYVGRDRNVNDKPLLFGCNNCDTLVRRAEPEDWIDPDVPRVSDARAMSEGRSIRQDARLRVDDISDVILKLRSVDPRHLDPEMLRTLTSLLTVEALLHNLTSTRPSVRQRAAESLMAHSMAKPAQGVNLNLTGDLPTDEHELLALAKTQADRLAELLEKRDGATTNEK